MSRYDKPPLGVNNGMKPSLGAQVWRELKCAGGGHVLNSSAQHHIEFDQTWQYGKVLHVISHKLN